MEGYIVFMSFLFLNVVTLHSPAFRIYDKVLVKVSQVRSGVYFSNHLSESMYHCYPGELAFTS